MCHGYWDARWSEWRAERREPEVTEIRDPDVREEPVEPVAEKDVVVLEEREELVPSS
jgi:hypothetical protein